jgi:PII-like signaling protein
MSEQPSNEPPPEPVRSSDDQTHEVVVKQVRDITRGGAVVFETGGGGDTGWRQVFPLTYDIPVDHPEAIETSEDE